MLIRPYLIPVHTPTMAPSSPKLICPKSELTTGERRESGPVCKGHWAHLRPLLWQGPFPIPLTSLLPRGLCLCCPPSCLLLSPLEVFIARLLCAVRLALYSPPDPGEEQQIQTQLTARRSYHKIPTSGCGEDASEKDGQSWTNKYPLRPT